MKKLISLFAVLMLVLVVNCGLDGGVSDDVASIMIVDASGAAGNEIGNLTVDKDDTLTLYCIGLNEDGDYVEDVDADWMLGATSTIGALIESTGTMVKLVASLYGTGSIEAYADDFEDQTGTITVAPAAPESLVSVTGDGSIDLSWKVSTSSGAITYNVYRSTDAVSAGTVIGQPTTNSYTAYIGNGTKYFYYVTATAGGQESDPTNMVDDAARPEVSETEAIWEYDSDGWSSYGWATDGSGWVISTQNALADSIDLYLKVEGSVLMMRSPDYLLNDGKRTEFYNWGTYGFNDPEVSDAASIDAADWTRSVDIEAGDVIAIKTESGYYIKVLIDDLEVDTDGDYSIMITYGYQTVQNYTNFKTAVQ